jgi:alpha-L-fucosidase 2
MSDGQAGSAFSRRGLLGGIAGGVAGGVASGVAGAIVTGAAAQAADPVEVETSDRWGRPRLRDLMTTDRQWSAFLADQDLVWQRMPTRYYEGPFLGNGFLGTMVYQELGQNTIRFDVQHSEVQDHRPEYTSLYGLGRLRIGYLTLEPVGKITGIDWRLDLWNAELRGTVRTDKGSLRLRVVVHNDRSVLLADVTPSRGERGFRWQFHPAVALPPRVDFRVRPAGYTDNPPPVTLRTGDIDLVVQPLTAGGETVTAWHEGRCDDSRTLLLNVAHSYPDLTAEQRAVDAVRSAASQPVDSLLRTHRRWWNAFYPKSFISVPDAKLQSFYWIQLYKIAAGARANAPVMATSGPWLVPTPWTATWWNLNVQLEYWLIHGSNHVELDAIRRSLDANRANLISAVPEPYRADSMAIPRTTDMFLSGGLVGVPGVTTATPEVGNLTWALHNVWLSYRHTMDQNILASVVFPLLRRAINYYLHFLYEGPDGRLHLPITESPEYGNAPDCNYDLALIRWGCQTLLDSATLLGITDSLAPKWQEVLAKLVDYPVDDNGFMIGAGVPFAMSHRHYSHMLSVYPLYLVNWEQPENRALIEKSLQHWVSFEGALQGYTFTGAASISAQMGRGNDALHYLGELLRRYIKPTTMYQESGPVVETPLSAAQSMHDMLCQSWGGVIRIFPAAPDAWADLTLHNFRTQGAFLASAVRRGGATAFVRVKSLAGAPCRLRHSIAGDVVVSGARHRDLGGGVIELDLRAGEEAIVYTGRPDFVIAPVRPPAVAAPWGLPGKPVPRTFVPLDLSGYVNGDGIATAANPAGGNFDGAGYSYPAEGLPAAGPVSFHGIEFTFPAEAANNYVLCKGQKVTVPRGRYTKVWFLAASTTFNSYPNPGAVYADGATVPMPLPVTEWVRGSAAFNDVEVLSVPYRYGPAGRDERRAGMYLQVAELDPTTDLVSLSLPNTNNPELRVFAISLEKAYSLEKA